LKSTKPETEIKEYLGCYNTLLSLAAAGSAGKFSALASPTLSKQETVSNLHDYVSNLACTGVNAQFPWVSLVEFLPRIGRLSFQLLCASIFFRVKSLPKSCIYFRTWLVPKSFQDDTLVDDYFRTLPDELSTSNEVIVSFQPLDYSLLVEFGRAARKRNQIISVGLLSVIDILKLILTYITSGRAKVVGSYIYNNRDIAPAINRSLLIDYFRLRSFQAYLDREICRKLRGYELKAFIYVFENQSWEKACCATLDRKITRLIGYQSSGFSNIFLNFFPTPLDAEKDPMPDTILTVGALFTRYLLEHSTYIIPVKTFAALRFVFPSDGKKYFVRKPNPNILKRVLYAFPVQFDQYGSTLEDLFKVFEGTSIEVHLKFHPVVRIDRIKILRDLPENFSVIDSVDMERLRDTYDVVLFDDNSFGLESLIFGVRSYQYNGYKRISCNRFFYFDLWNPNIDFIGLVGLKDAIEVGSYEKNYEINHLHNYFNSMYKLNLGACSDLSDVILA